MKAPDELRELIKTATRQELPDLIDEGIHTAANINFYVLSWTSVYALETDTDHATLRLRAVLEAWERHKAQKG